MNNTIKAFFTDVDGTLTDGSLYYDKNGETLKVFNVKDGKGLKLWNENRNNLCGIISAKDSAALRFRINELRIQHMALGIEDKFSWMENWLHKNQLEWKNLAYIGDDLNDLDIIIKCGYSACPSDAVQIIREKSDYVCNLSGGKGCVREFIDLLLTV